MESILQAISDEIGSCIKEHYSDIGVMSGLKAKFIKNTSIQQWADYFIRIDMATIEQLGEERNEHEKRLAELRRARQDRASDGDGNQVSARTGLFNQPQFWDYGDRQTHTRF